MPVADAHHVLHRMRTQWPYFMHYEARVGQNLALGSDASDAHEWGYYPRMVDDEAIVFVTCHSEHAQRKGAVGVVHTAFDDPSIDGAGVPRRSVELRTVAWWE